MSQAPGAGFHFPASLTARDGVAGLGLVVLWALAAWLVDPSGDFPLNDDFAYALSVRWLLEDGVFERTPWTYVPSLTNVLFGALFALRDAPLFESLRLSTLTAAAAALTGGYVLARQAGATSAAAACAALALAVNPVAFDLSFTFMTDVHTLAWLVWGLVFAVEALRAPRGPFLALVVLASVAGVLIRQTALALPLAFGAAAVLCHPRSRAHWIAALGVGAASFGALASFEAVLAPDTLPVYDPRVIAWQVQTQHVEFHALRNGVVTIVYLGVFLAPIAALAVARPPRRRLAAGLVAACAAVVAVGFVVFDLRPLPGGNIIRDLGLGPLDLPGSAHLPTAPVWVWRALTALGVLVSGVTLALLAERARELARSPVAVLLLAFAAAHLGVHAIRSPYFDRYMIPALPALFAVLLGSGAARIPGRAWAASAALLAGLAAFAIAGTHDDLARHRAAMALAREAEARGAPPLRVEAGFPHRGWQHHHRRRPESRRGAAPPDRWAETPEWMVMIEPRRAEVAAEGRRAYRRWLPPGDEEMLLIPASAAGALGMAE